MAELTRERLQDWYDGWHPQTEILATQLRNFGIVATRVMEQLLRASRPGYYLRDGKVRRDHAYFRQRARDRRAALKRLRA